MIPDIADLTAYYQSPLGATMQNLLGARLRAFWPDLHGQSLIGLGYASPYLDLFREETERTVAVMPGVIGVQSWPAGERGLAALADETELPFQDYAFDRLLMVHALEISDHPGDLLEEAWRILAGGGRLLLVVPNRRSFWAVTEKTPFGSGQPYSAGQLVRLLKSHSFTPLRQAKALFFLPFGWQSWLAAATGWERFAACCLPGLGGVILIEAIKQVHGALPVKARRRRRLTTLLPLPEAALA